MLTRYESIHFRDYMALRLTPLMGTMAYQDRMGDDHPTLVESGRLVQGYSVSGPLDPSARAAVDRDLGDPRWRALFELTHAMRMGEALVPGPAALLRLLEASRAQRRYTVAIVQGLARPSLTLEEAYEFEYGLALLKTSAAQVYTIRLAEEQQLLPVTDSHAHYALLNQTLMREGLDLGNACIGITTEHEAPHHTLDSH
ncbi:MAG: hypothetical protein K0S58_3438, partial [Nitrospira sp.]|nr:hypothetical protein [Nitrospira sp.]